MLTGSMLEFAVPIAIAVVVVALFVTRPELRGNRSLRLLLVGVLAFLAIDGLITALILGSGVQM